MQTPGHRHEVRRGIQSHKNERSGLVNGAIPKNTDSRNKSLLKKEFKAWDKLSDEALLNFKKFTK